MGRLRRVASRAKAVAARPLSQRTYWHLMGRFRAVPAVTSQYSTLEESLDSGREVVDLLVHLDVVDPSATTLQIGSGIGRVEYHLAPLVKHAHGADVSPAMVQRARELVPWDNAEFTCTDGTTLDAWADNSLDVVYSFFVFQHMPRATFRRYLALSHDKLARGGALVFQVMIDETGEEPEPPANHPYALRHFTRAQVLEALRAAGFSSAERYLMDGKPDDERPHGDVVFLSRR